MRRTIKWVVIALVAAVVVVQFLPDEIRIPGRWPPRMPRVEVVHEGARTHRPAYAELASTPAPVAPAPVAPPPVVPDTAPAVAPPPPAPVAHDTVAPVKPKKKVVRRAPPKPAVEEPEPEPEAAWFEKQPSMTVVPTKVTTEVRLSSPALDDSTAKVSPAIEARDSASGGSWPILCGQVVDTDGEPVPDATVQVDGTELVERTDAKGLFCLPCPPGRREVVVGTETRGSVRCPIHVDGAKPQVRVTLPPSK